MLSFKHLSKANAREQLLEVRIENLQERIHELERRSSLRFSLQADCKNKIEKNRSSYLVLPITYTPVEETSPKLEIVPNSPTTERTIPLVFVEKSKERVYETVV
jgi:hypothetical protein